MIIRANREKHKRKIIDQSSAVLSPSVIILYMQKAFESSVRAIVEESNDHWDPGICCIGSFLSFQLTERILWIQKTKYVNCITETKNPFWKVAETKRQWLEINEKINKNQLDIWKNHNNFGSATDHLLWDKCWVCVVAFWAIFDRHITSQCCNCNRSQVSWILPKWVSYPGRKQYACIRLCS